MLVEAFTAIEALPFAVALRSGRWSYAAVNASHIVGVALLLGAIVPFDLRLIGCWRSIPIRTLERVLLPVAIAGLLLAATMGLLLFSVRAVEYAGTTIFQVKLALIAGAVVNALLLRRGAEWQVALDAIDAEPPLRLRLAGGLSILLWLAVIASGRAIAFVD